MAEIPERHDTEWYAFWHKFEHGLARVGILSTAVAIVLGLVVVGLSWLVVKQNEAIGKLSADRIMIGFCDERGVFTSAKDLPEHFVMRYARSFINNFFVYGPEGVAQNMNEARRLMEPQLAIRYHQYFQDTIDLVRRDYINQMFSATNYIVTRTSDGYLVRFQGILTQYAGRTQLSEPRNLTLTTRIRRVPITQEHPEGLVITHVTDKESFEAPVQQAPAPQTVGVGTPKG